MKKTPWMSPVDIESSHELFEIFDEELYARVGNHHEVLAIAAAGGLSSTLIITADNVFDEWRKKLTREALKDPKHDVYVHDKPFPLRLENGRAADPRRVKYFRDEARVTLTSFKVLDKEQQIVRSMLPKGANLSEKKLFRKFEKKSDFFRKHWSLIVVQNAEQIPFNLAAADAAVKLQTIKSGRRFWVYSKEYSMMVGDSQIASQKRKLEDADDSDLSDGTMEKTRRKKNAKKPKTKTKTKKEERRSGKTTIVNGVIGGRRQSSVDDKNAAFENELNEDDEEVLGKTESGVEEAQLSMAEGSLFIDNLNRREADGGDANDGGEGHVEEVNGGAVDDGAINTGVVGNRAIDGGESEQGAERSTA